MTYNVLLYSNVWFCIKKRFSLVSSPRQRRDGFRVCHVKNIVMAGRKFPRKLNILDNSHQTSIYQVRVTEMQVNNSIWAKLLTSFPKGGGFRRLFVLENIGPELGRGVLPYMGYLGMCGPKGYSFSAVLVISRVSILTILPPFSSKIGY